MEKAMMTCKKCQAYQLVAVLEPEKVSPAIWQAMVEHQDECPACQDSADRLDAVLEALRPSQITEEMFQQTHDNVMAAIRRNREARQWRKVARWIGSAAAVLAISFAVWYFRPAERASSTELSHREVREGTATPAPSSIPTVAEKSQTLSRAEEAKSALALAFEQATDAPSAFTAINEAYEKATKRPEGGDFAEMITLCEQLRQKWPDSTESLESMKLISRCWTQLAEPKKAQETFLAYADEAGERAALTDKSNQISAADDGMYCVSRIILEEARRLLDEKAEVAAMSYTDVLLTRYPNTEPAREAHILIGECYRKTSQPHLAARQYKAVIAEAPGSPAALRARSLLPSALLDAQRPDEAVTAWVAYSDSATDVQEKAWGYYCAGKSLSLRGPQYREEAMRLLKTAVEQYPKSRSAMLAKARLSVLRSESASPFIQGGDPLDVLNGAVNLQPMEPPAWKDILRGQTIMDVLEM